MDVEVIRDGGGGGGVNFQPCSCSCSCPYCGSGSQPYSLFPRTLKRKLEQMEGDVPEDVARVEIEIEAAALREAVSSQQQSIQGLYSELEEERAAASTAASEAMSMILRLQREKAEAQMEARQFKLLAEEKMSHDQEEIALLEDLIFRRDQTVQSLSCELQAYHHRLLSFGINPVPAEPNPPADVPAATTSTAAVGDSNAYHSLRCEMADFRPNAADLDLKYVAGDTPRSPIRRMPSFVVEKGVIGKGQSPSCAQRPQRRLSNDSCGSPSFQQEFGSSDFPSMTDRASDTCAGGKDDVSDRVYTIDAVHCLDAMRDGADMSTPREFLSRRDSGNKTVDDGEIQRLYMRLQALEADRESMRHAIMTMGTDKAQRILLKEIAQQLCKEVVPETRVVKKPCFVRSFSVMSVFKWVASFFFWRKNSQRIKYPMGLSNQQIGLLVILDKSQRRRLKWCLTRVPM
ncbi:myosin-binding protein 7 [Phalaenopsis equestris]|uniref:myosin-binding protein 7 n=1 Tax=Phalaenopsis equestris TaxID=78828 RepID=UPI0009E64198|nr:myosin-binding protein 7 [Phalaenopsis equestris]